MTHASLFSGIGGFDLAAEWMGWQNLFHCEIDEFCQTVLKYYWPDAKTYKDIRNTDFTIWRGRIDVLSGGFPCQPFSVAGKRKGTEDDRHHWPEMLRAIREIAPGYVVGENVGGLYSWDGGLVFESVCADLENEGYEVQPYRIPACATNAPHRRDRWWVVAHANGNRKVGKKRNGYCCDIEQYSKAEIQKWKNEQFGAIAADTNASYTKKAKCKFSGNKRCRRNGLANDIIHSPYSDGKWKLQQKGTEQNKRRRTCDGTKDVANTGHEGLQGNEQRRTPEQRPGPPRPIAERFENESWLEAATRLCSVVDGIPGRLDGITVPKWRIESLKAYGNAIVPKIAFVLFKIIEKING